MARVQRASAFAEKIFRLTDEMVNTSSEIVE